MGFAERQAARDRMRAAENGMAAGFLVGCFLCLVEFSVAVLMGWPERPNGAAMVIVLWTAIATITVCIIAGRLLAVARIDAALAKATGQPASAGTEKETTDEMD